jgi:ComF family protein
MSKVDNCLAFLSRSVLPWRCLVCGERGDGRDLCAACFVALPWNRSACARCGLPMATSAVACGACLSSPPPFASTHAALVYGFPLDRLLPRFKFHADLAAGRLLAELLCAGIGEGELPHALVPVPLHRERLRERGYDQALELAKAVARRTGVPLRASALRRKRATARQSDLDLQARLGNLRGAFEPADASLPKHVALVDDVMTTGATLRECATTLLRGGVARVDVWVAARAPRAL